MLGLDGAMKGEEGLDEASRELLSDLKSFPADRAGRIASSEAGKTGHDGDETGAGASTETDTGMETGVVRFMKRARWFGVSISGKTQDGEDIGLELDRCFRSIQRKLSPYVHRSPPEHRYLT